MEKFFEFCKLSAKLLKPCRKKTAESEAAMYELIQEMFQFNDGTGLLIKETRWNIATASMQTYSDEEAEKVEEVYRLLVNSLYLKAKVILAADSATDEQWQDLLEAARIAERRAVNDVQRDIIVSWSVYSLNYIDRQYMAKHPRKEAV